MTIVEVRGDLMSRCWMHLMMHFITRRSLFADSVTEFFLLSFFSLSLYS